MLFLGLVYIYFKTWPAQVGIRRCYAGYLRRKMLLLFYAIGGRAEQMNDHLIIGGA
jgi:hypothetical protein